MISIKRFLLQPIDNSPLILFRIFFGLLMLAESWGSILTGWVYETFVDVNFTFHFFGFGFIQHFVGPQMNVIYFLLGLMGLFIAIGYRYRLAIISFTVLWAITYFGQKSHYNNHYYLVLLISFLMWFVPANSYASIDVKQGRVESSIICPKWSVWLFIIQIAIVYFYATIAKLYPDWLAGRPLEIWFTSKSYTSPLWSNEFADKLRTFFSQHSTHLFFAYAGIFFDLLVIPFFLWNKWSRWFALLASLGFHLTNSAIFHIGVFPYFALSFVVFFFQPETIRKRFFPKKGKPYLEHLTTVYSFPTWFVPIMGIYFIIQLLLPIRHHFIPGNVLWDESGHRLSWRMMLRTKLPQTRIYIQRANEKRELVDLSKYLKNHQYYDCMAKPDMLWFLVQRIKREYEGKGEPDVRLFIDAKLSVNGREFQQFTNKDVDVAKEPWHYFDRQPWVLNEPDQFHLLNSNRLNTH